MLSKCFVKRLAGLMRRGKIDPQISMRSDRQVHTLFVEILLLLSARSGLRAAEDGDSHIGKRTNEFFGHGNVEKHMVDTGRIADHGSVGCRIDYRM